MAIFGHPKYSLALKFTNSIDSRTASRTINWVNLDKFNRRTTQEDQSGFSVEQLDAFISLYAAAANGLTLAGKSATANYEIL